MKPPPGWGTPPPALPPPPPAWPNRPPPPPVESDDPHAGPPRDPSRNNWLLVGAIGAGLVFLLAFAASGARSLGRSKGHPDYGSVAVRAGVGSAIALAVGLAALIVARYAAHRDNPLARALVPERPITTRALVARSLPWLAVLLALGAVLGAATAPLYRAGTSSRDDSTGESVDPRLPEVTARLAHDADDGEIHVQVDPDGDGVYETLEPCPTTGSNENPDVSDEPTPEDPLLVPIDYECDGVIDAYARLESLNSRTRIQPAPTTAPGTGPRPDDPDQDTYGGEVDPTAERYDGIYARDENGDVRLYIDADGDGTYETPMGWCPLDSGTRRVPSTSIPDDGSALVGIDNNCDGTFDAYARVEDFQVLPAPPAGAAEVGPRGATPPPTAPPVTAPPATAAPASEAPDAGSGPGTRDADGSRGDGDGGGGGLPLPVIVLLIALGGAALAALGYVASRSLLEPEEPEGPADKPGRDTDDDAPAEVVGARGAITSSLDDLAGPVDPREAIINAYARLLAGLAAGGIPRRDSETPGQYLQRCVNQLGVPSAPMAELTDLFNAARFSSHPMTEAQRVIAAACLERSLADLQHARDARDSLAGATS